MILASHGTEHEATEKMKEGRREETEENIKPTSGSKPLEKTLKLKDND